MKNESRGSGSGSVTPPDAVVLDSSEISIIVPTSEYHRWYTALRNGSNESVGQPGVYCPVKIVWSHNKDSITNDIGIWANRFFVQNVVGEARAMLFFIIYVSLSL